MSGFDNDVVYAAGATITGPTTINSGTGTMNISTDAANTTANFATGAGVKLTTVGSTTGASSLALKTGSVGYTLASGYGTIMSATAAGAVSCTLGDFDVTRSSASGNVVILASNTDATSITSHAQLQTRADPAGGDPKSVYTITGILNWSTGIDNSDSDAYVISQSVNLGTANCARFDTAGAVSFPRGNVDITRGSSGADVSDTISNTSNTATSSATQYITVAGGTAADARVQYAVTGVTTWTEGIDNSDSDAYVLAASNALGTTNVIHATTAGYLNYPLQAAFLAYVNTTLTNKTGDATDYTIIFDTEQYDQNNNFNLGTSTFTAPVTGKYRFEFACRLTGGTSITACTASIVTTAHTYTNIMYYTPGSTTEVTGVVTVLADMTANDTATFHVKSTDSGGKIDDVSGLVGGALVTYVSGSLVC